MFINFSNHPHDNWDVAQKNAAAEYGEIQDVPFPAIEASASEEDITNLAKEYASKIKGFLGPGSAVMAQGEFTLTYAVINLLKQDGIKVVSACSERNVVESVDENGNTIRKSVFSFIRFREYV